MKIDLRLMGLHTSGPGLACWSWRLSGGAMFKSNSCFTPFYGFVSAVIAVFAGIAAKLCIKLG
jgi:hypothetical protein